MDDFEQLWNNYQAQIRSENRVSERMQKEFWDIVYPLILVKATQIAMKYRGKHESITIIEPEELIQDAYKKLFDRIKNNPKPLVFKNLDKFIGHMYVAMKNLTLDQKKKEKKYKGVNDNEIDDINFISDEYSEAYSEEYSENYNEEYTEYNTEEFSLTDSLNNIEVYDFFTAFSSFREKYEDCHELISAREFEPKLPYKEIKEQDRFVNLSLGNLRKIKDRCMDSLKDFINKYYPKLAL